MRHEIGKKYAFIKEVYVRSEPGYMCTAYVPWVDKLIGIHILIVECKEHHKVAWEYRPEEKIYDGYVMHDADGIVYHNQYPHADMGQTSSASNILRRRWNNKEELNDYQSPFKEHEYPALFTYGQWGNMEDYIVNLDFAIRQTKDTFSRSMLPEHEKEQLRAHLAYVTKLAESVGVTFDMVEYENTSVYMANVQVAPDARSAYFNAEGVEVFIDKKAA